MFSCSVATLIKDKEKSGFRITNLIMWLNQKHKTKNQYLKEQKEQQKSFSIQMIKGREQVNITAEKIWFNY